jgi:hypothetical protein
VFVGKYKTVNPTRDVICSHMDGSSDKDMQVRLTDKCVSKAYHLHKKQEAKLVLTRTILNI